MLGTGHAPLTFESEAADGLAELAADASLIVLPDTPLRPLEHRPVPALTISDPCLALTEGLSQYGD